MGNRPCSRIDEDDGSCDESCSGSTSNSSSSVSNGIHSNVMLQHPRDQHHTQGNQSVAVTEEALKGHDKQLSEEKIVIALPGRIGCVISSSPQSGPFVCEIHKISPLEDDLKLGDRILSVDGEDVQQMSAADVSKLLGSRSNQERRIHMLRAASSSSLESQLYKTSGEDMPRVSQIPGARNGNMSMYRAGVAALV